MIAHTIFFYTFSLIAIISAQEVIVKLKQEISKMCKIFFIFSSMPKVKYYCQFEIMYFRIPFIFYLSRMKVYVVEDICNRIDCWRIIDNICVYYL